MIKVLTTTTALALALALSAPSQAHGLGGGLGIGGGLPMGGINGGFGINGTLDAGGDTIRSTSNISDHTTTTTRAPKPPKTAATPKLTTTATTTTSALTGSARAVVTSANGRVTAVSAPVRRDITTETAHVVMVPAIPDYAVRRSAIIETGIAPIAYGDAPAYIDTQYQVLQNDLRGTGVEVVKRGQQIVLEMPSDVTFAFNKYDIQPRFHPVLDAVAQTLTKYPATYIDVDGHTDAIGSLAYNQNLSEERAFSVANYLSERTVTPARMHVQGFGKTEPIASNATVMGRAANRRVEIILTPYVQ